WELLLEARTQILTTINNQPPSYPPPRHLNKEREAAAAAASQPQPDSFPEQQGFLQALIDTIPSPIFYKDLEGRYLGCNAAFEKYIGLVKAELIGKSVYDIAPQELADKYHEKDVELFKEPGMQVYEASVKYADGSLHQVIFNKATFLAPDGSPAGLVGVILDITEQKQNQALLIKRAVELETVAEVSAAASTILDVDKLLQEVADLTKERFGLYHAHIYLLDETGEVLQLAIGAGSVGRQMVTEGWSIPSARKQSLVARAARTGQGVIVNDVQEDPGWLPNPLLPETRAEMAVPMMVGDQVLGVLDIQSEVVNRFTEEDVQIQTTLATQVAVALKNAQLFSSQDRIRQQLQQRVRELHCLNDIGRKTEETVALPDLLQWVAGRIPEAMQYPELCQVAIDYDHNTYGLADAKQLPNQMTHGLYTSDQQITGRIYIAYSDKRDFINEESALLGAIATRLSDHIENRRLFEQTQAALAEARQSQALLRMIIDATPDWIFIKDGEHRYRLVNQGYATALHLTPDDFIGKNDLDLGFPEELVKGNPEKSIRGFWADDRLVLETGETQVYPNDPATIDGEIHVFHTIKAPLRDAEGKIWGVMAFARDITEREQLLADVGRRARREQTIREITEKMRSASSLQELVKTTARELGQRLAAGHALIELGIETSEPEIGPSTNGQADS
ncbi:MAG: PAS domain-containing protein, partial [Chloroflexota bacterium]